MISGDEFYIHHNDPENKRQSMEYYCQCSQEVRKSKTVLSGQKTMLTIFGNTNRTIYIEFLPKEMLINLIKYCENLLTLKKHIHTKCPKRTFWPHENTKLHWHQQKIEVVKSL